VAAVLIVAINIRNTKSPANKCQKFLFVNGWCASRRFHFVNVIKRPYANVRQTSLAIVRPCLAIDFAVQYNALGALSYVDRQTTSRRRQRRFIRQLF
jgi:hypothetical protein